MDLIDLLFKSHGVDKSKDKYVVQQNPILLTDNFFKKFSFTFLIAANQISDIHPLTLVQLNYLANQQNINFKCIMRLR